MYFFQNRVLYTSYKYPGLSVSAQDLSGETGDRLNPHIPGAYSLLQLRGRSQLNTKYGRELFGWAVTQVVCPDSPIVNSFIHRLTVYCSKHEPLYMGNSATPPYHSLSQRCTNQTIYTGQVLSRA